MPLTVVVLCSHDCEKFFRAAHLCNLAIWFDYCGGFVSTKTRIAWGFTNHFCFLRHATQVQKQILMGLTGSLQLWFLSAKTDVSPNEMFSGLRFSR